MTRIPPHSSLSIAIASLLCILCLVLRLVLCLCALLCIVTYGRIASMIEGKPMGDFPFFPTQLRARFPHKKQVSRPSEYVSNRSWNTASVTPATNLEYVRVAMSVIQTPQRAPLAHCQGRNLVRGGQWQLVRWRTRGIACPRGDVRLAVGASKHGDGAEVETRTPAEGVAKVRVVRSLEHTSVALFSIQEPPERAGSRANIQLNEAPRPVHDCQVRPEVFRRHFWQLLEVWDCCLGRLLAKSNSLGSQRLYNIGREAPNRDGGKKIPTASAILRRGNDSRTRMVMSNISASTVWASMGLGLRRPWP